jgi:hypothetical protein
VFFLSLLSNLSTWKALGKGDLASAFECKHDVQIAEIYVRTLIQIPLCKTWNNPPQWKENRSPGPIHSYKSSHLFQAVGMACVWQQH